MESFYGKELGRAQLLFITKGKEYRAPRSKAGGGNGAEIEEDVDEDGSWMARSQAFSSSAVKSAKPWMPGVGGFGANQ